VRFFEERKLVRRLKSAERQADEAVGQPEAADGAVTVASLRADLVYVRNFPAGVKYLSLFPTGGLDEATIAKQRLVSKSPL
jgi:hypothetical protein